MAAKVLRTKRGNRRRRRTGRESLLLELAFVGSSPRGASGPGGLSSTRVTNMGVSRSIPSSSSDEDARSVSSSGMSKYAQKADSAEGFMTSTTSISLLICHSRMRVRNR